MSAVADNTGSRLKTIVAVVGLLCGELVSNPGQAQTDWRFSGIERVVAVADIHGAYGAFEEILKDAALIDDNLSWSGDATHLVIVGDVLDRGPDSRRALDLIRKLEPEAIAAGGRVHLVLGNHEVMNLTGDLRYVSADEFAAFANEEPLDIRAAEFERYIRDLDAGSDRAVARTMFDAAYPVGFFAHREAFSADGEYGRWLLGKPMLLVINDTAFVHGGMAQAMVENDSLVHLQLAEELNDYVTAIETLVSADLMSRTVEVYDMPARANELLALSEFGNADADAEAEAATDTNTDAIISAARRLLGLDSMILYAPDGLLWYRGSVACNGLTEQDRLGAALEVVGAERLVVGHTPTQGALVLSRMDELLLRIDTGMLNDYYGGRASALVIEDGELSVLYPGESDPAEPLAQPRRVGVRPGNLTAEQLEGLLTVADVGTSQRFDGTATLVTLFYRDVQLLGLFTRANREDVRAEVAAYRIDRLLGLDMVPVTVAREIEGVEGAIQFWPEASISEPERRAQGLGSSAWCPLGDQFNDMYLFDALIFNEARTLERIRYSTDNFQLLLIGHDQSFSTESGRPAYLESLPVELSPAWRSGLSKLDETTLTEALGDVLNRRQIRALLARRNLLLEIAD